LGERTSSNLKKEMSLMKEELMSLKKFDELAQVHEAHCVSIYIPTHRVGNEGNKEDRIRFKDMLKEVREELINAYGLKEREVDELLKPGQELVDDGIFWHYNGEGLAFFCSPERCEFFRLPIGFEPFHHVSDNFYLHPLFPFFNGDGRFYVLGISEKMTKLWEGSRYRLREVPLPEDFPAGLEDVVGHDHEEKTLQERSFQGGSSQKVMHGHGEGKDDSRSEVERFFQDVDHRLSKLLRDESVPLVFAGVEENFGLYRKVAQYRQLEEGGYLNGTPEQMKPDDIHAKAWEIVKKHFDEDRDHYIERYKDHMGGMKAIYDNADVVRAAVEGRVEALFVEKGVHIYGRYNSEEQEVRFAEEHSPQNEDLVELAAMNTYRKKGRVFLLESERMPEASTQLNALLRY
jgi:hypothetical protein